MKFDAKGSLNEMAFNTGTKPGTRRRGLLWLSVTVMCVVAIALLARSVGAREPSNPAAPAAVFRPPYFTLVSICRDPDYQQSQRRCQQRDAIYTPSDIAHGHVWLCIIFNRSVEISGTVFVKDNANDMRPLQVTWHGSASKGVGGSHCDRLVVSVREKVAPLISMGDVPIGGYGLYILIDGQYDTGTGFEVWANGVPPSRWP